MNEQKESRLYAREQEQAVLGALLLTNDAADRIGDLAEAHFYDATHRDIFKAITSLIYSAKPADVITVFDYLQTNGKQVDISYLNALEQSTPSAVNVARYAAIVRDRAMKRGLVAACMEVAEQVESSPDDAEVLVDRMTSELERLAHARTGSEPMLARDDLAQHIESIDERYQGGGVKAISTGFEDLDQQLNGGLRRGNLIVVAARPKMGKTTLALNVANHVSHDSIAAVLSMEMGRTELHDRNLASLGGIQMDRVTDPRKMMDEDWPRLTMACQKINEMRLYIDPEPGLTLMKVRGKLKKIKRSAGGLDLAVIDYLQLMNGDGDNRNAQIEGITRGLKNLAKELDVPIMLLSQLNRKLEDRPNKRPLPSDLRDSGSIEQDADVVIFLYRDEIYNKDSPDRGTAEAIVALNRQGPAGSVRLVFQGEYTRFQNLSRDWRPVEGAKKTERRRGFSAD